MTAFNGVLFAVFIAGGTEDVDANLETVRLLRSQLRSKSSLRVIEDDVLPLDEMARDQGTPHATNGDDAAPARPEPAPAGNTPGSAASGAPEQPSGAIRDEKDLEPYETLFANVDLWKK